MNHNCLPIGRWEYNPRLDDKSRMSREAHVRFRESVKVRFLCATRLVIMSRYKAQGYKIKLESMLKPMKLRLKAKKTRIIDAEKQSFDFIGFTFIRKPSPVSGRMSAYYFPSSKAVNAVKGRIRQVVNHHRPIKAEEVARELTPILRGWVNYFRMANSSEKFGKVRFYAAQRMRKFMRRRRQRSGYGYRQYPDRYLYQKLGLYNNYRVSWMKTL